MPTTSMNVSFDSYRQAMVEAQREYQRLSMRRLSMCHSMRNGIRFFFDDDRPRFKIGEEVVVISTEDGKLHKRYKRGDKAICFGKNKSGSYTFFMQDGLKQRLSKKMAKKVFGKYFRNRKKYAKHASLLQPFQIMHPGLKGKRIIVIAKDKDEAIIKAKKKYGLNELLGLRKIEAHKVKY